MVKIMYLEKISLTNSRIRIALKHGDTKSIEEATIQLCNNNRYEAALLIKWFSIVANSCKNKIQINLDMSMMRMWQLGNIDIVEVSNNGTPKFMLTNTGADKIKNLPKEQWFKVLLWRKKSLMHKA